MWMHTHTHTHLGFFTVILVAYLWCIYFAGNSDRLWLWLSEW